MGAEFHERFDLTERSHLTPAVRWLRNLGFDTSGDAFDADQALGDVRVGYGFLST